MQNTVPAQVKPSGGIVAPAFTAPPAAPVVEDRTITYQPKHGSVLVDECPSWCVKDHAEDITGLVNAEDLVHEGEEIGLSFTADGESDTILSAQIAQWPYSDCDGSEVPFMALRPVGMEFSGYLSPDDVEVEIRRVEAHLAALREMNEQLTKARAEHREHRSTGRLTAADVEAMPIPALLAAFGLAVVEVGEMPHQVQGFLDRTGPKPTVFLLRTLPQDARASVVRQLLTAVVEGQA
ncbi:DUF6907 domain-containing protein [Streptomyces globisporus]|uniref:DUF6907 domain-containing protein n=1 Tax=Streptomyces globisporus TaxID=1908 RepID=UPI0036CE339A